MPLDKGLDTKSLRTILIDELKYQYLVAHIADGRSIIPECFGVQRSRVLNVSC